jgi:hypothetical protein
MSLSLVGSLLAAFGQSSPALVIDASRPYREPGPARYDEGSARTPTGEEIGVNSRYLTLDGKPWLPVMGEFHFTRYPANRWEEEILKMKAAGVNIIATYVIWIHHEEIEGQFDWSGQRDLRAFAQLCAKHHMLVVARIGPWAHGEVRSGGFPDWVVKRGNTRQNDPFYLQSVRTFYGQIGKQLNGLLWKDGGPVIGIQLENEYARRGPGAGEAHILELKKLARESGLDVPLYTVTAWDNAVVPERGVVPVYGGYPDSPWDDSLEAWPPAEVYAFRVRSRVAADHAGDETMQQPVPFLTAEVGGGNEVTYHRRPVLGGDDIAAILPVMIGSGDNLYGTYMFQGGENPDGKLTTLEESQATGYPNDVPVKSYDFQAPLGEFGQERESFRKLKVFQYFLNDFGSDLAPMTVSAPTKQPASPRDLEPLRATVRSRGDQGFLFLNNYVRGGKMPSRPAAQFEIRLPSGTLRLPRKPVDIPSGAYFIWTFNLQVNGVRLRYATAQLFTRMENAGELTLFFAAVPGIPVEFAIDATHARIEHTSSGVVTREDGAIFVSGIEPGIDSSADVVTDQGARVRLVALSREEAEDAWKVRLGGDDRLLLTKQDFFWNGDADTHDIWLRQCGARQFIFTVTPALDSTPHASLPLQRSGGTAAHTTFTAVALAADWELKYHLLQPAAATPEVKLGPVTDLRAHPVAQAPAGPAFQHAARWAIDIPPGSMHGLSDLFLKVRYTGDVARLYGPNALLTDNFYNGQPWSVALSRFLDLSRDNRLTLDVLPLRADAPIYIQAPKRPDFDFNGQAVRVDDLELVPEYELVVDATTY